MNCHKCKQLHTQIIYAKADIGTAARAAIKRPEVARYREKLAQAKEQLTRQIEQREYHEKTEHGA